MSLHYLAARKPEDPAVFLGMDAELSDSLNRWRLAQASVPETRTAICRLLRLALEAEGVSRRGNNEIAALVQAFKSFQAQD